MYTNISLKILYISNIFFYQCTLLSLSLNKNKKKTVVIVFLYFIFIYIFAFLSLSDILKIKLKQKYTFFRKYMILIKNFCCGCLSSGFFPYKTNNNHKKGVILAAKK